MSSSTLKSLVLGSLLILVTTLACAKKEPTPSNTTTKSPPLTRPGKDFLPQVAEGFQVRRWADVPNARSLAVSSDGKAVFVGSREDFVSKVTVGDKGVTVEPFQKGLEAGNGVCFLGEDLLVAQRTSILRYRAPEGLLPNAKGEVFLDGLPGEKHHGWRYIGTSPEQRVVIAIGAPCNVCERPDDPRFATLCSVDSDGGDFQIIAKGVRNSVGFDWHPETGELTFTDNGRDMLGDDIPPCELNVLQNPGDHFGFPYLYGANVPDPEYGNKAPDLEFVKPVVEFQAHVAPLGCHFPRQSQLKEKLGSSVLVAQHGSWNRSSKVGYRVVTVDPEQEKPVAKPFLWGFVDPKDDKKIFGRPVDVAELPDGTLLVSDDFGSVIWAVNRTQEKR